MRVNAGSKWALGCAGFLAVMVAAAMFGFWQMAQKYGMTSEPPEVLERSLSILPLEFPAPLEPGYAMYTASEQGDPLAIWGVNDLRSKTVVMLVSFAEEASLEEFSNRLHNIRRDLAPWRVVLSDGVPARLMVAGMAVAGRTGNYVAEDGIERTAVLTVLPWEGGSVLVAAEGRKGDVDVPYVQALLDPLSADSSGSYAEQGADGG